jgi:hypothetical protein
VLKLKKGELIAMVIFVGCPEDSGNSGGEAFIKEKAPKPFSLLFIAYPCSVSP